MDGRPLEQTQDKAHRLNGPRPREAVGFFVVDMDISVGEHIAALEARVNALASKLMDEKDRAKRKLIEAEIRAAQTALGHYQAALDLESTLRGEA